MTITVYGMPGPQGSKKYVGRSKSGRGIMVESSAKVPIWREAVKAAAMDGFAPHMAFIGPVEVRMAFTLPKPKSAPKRRKSWPDRKPDLSKLIRSTEDALTDAGVWEDDARVIRITATKVYPNEGTDSLHIPGAVISIKEAKE